ncbi:hypothetical protein [Streptococcus equi]|uniref:Phage protein n=1 Tax=Streptococcus equi subsp. equi TaxID=148942 RepID=A0A380JR16_9STRE|nr:hypothetical protein [Streptococcus equi]SUN47215.1 Uncharacterised protein [Streptococcus equi subsp. equi]HEK9098496.1 hypothetical protein [Streptococcus equi subsp. zooepidemicus]HEL0614611.1 hypothetical protein [Streptococcus equi subsp. zooepidemicus]HEL1230122.1 hypothetical protein [Streptococcus equi subsp. zooepidemicus]
MKKCLLVSVAALLVVVSLGVRGNVKANSYANFSLSFKERYRAWKQEQEARKKQLEKRDNQKDIIISVEEEQRKELDKQYKIAREMLETVSFFDRLSKSRRQKALYDLEGYKNDRGGYRLTNIKKVLEEAYQIHRRAGGRVIYNPLFNEWKSY